MDTLTPAQRSERMSRVRSKDTKPEMLVRTMVHQMGFRYRLHVKTLPGNPDMVFPSRGKIIFVHGCFWHRHGAQCDFTRWPKSKLDFWRPKLEQNHERDKIVRRELRKLGWQVLTLWECQMKNSTALATRVRKFLEA
jgi:DNA mismatch endonuclease (patch repair protein)